MVALSVLAPSLVAVALLLVLSAFFSSSESAIFSLPADWRPTDGSGSPETRALDHLREDPHRLLVTLLVGNNVVNIALTSVITLLVASAVRPGLAVVVSTVCASVVVLVFGEIVPKSYGLGHARSWSLRVARPIGYVELALGPLVTVFDLVTGRLTAVIGGDQGIEEPYLGE